jgi:Arc/MetJ family transcription regulator
MKTTVNIDDDLLTKARRLTRIDKKTALVRAGLEALSARRYRAYAGRGAPPHTRIASFALTIA